MSRGALVSIMGRRDADTIIVVMAEKYIVRPVSLRLEFLPTQGGQYTAALGATYIAVVQFSRPLRARVLLT